MTSLRLSLAVVECLAAAIVPFLPHHREKRAVLYFFNVFFSVAQKSDSVGEASVIIHNTTSFRNTPPASQAGGIFSTHNDPQASWEVLAERRHEEFRCTWSRLEVHEKWLVEDGFGMRTLPVPIVPINVICSSLTKLQDHPANCDRRPDSSYGMNVRGSLKRRTKVLCNKNVDGRYIIGERSYTKAPLNHQLVNVRKTNSVAVLEDNDT
ncbi:hypothetical protein BDR06DRAFT_970232 [Suillus hirtellus]|nr:hypothetical protein BDR06DRAFT_970232 [Suillus hirtellus]